MPSFHDFIFAWAIGGNVFIAIFICLVILCGIAMAIRFSIGILIAFFYHVAKQIFNLAKWVIGFFVRKYMEHILKIEGKHKNDWWGRNFDFFALFRVSVPLLIVFFLLSFWDAARVFIKDFTLLIGALLGFPILIKRMAEMREQTRISREQLHFSQYADAYEKLWSSDLGTRMKAIKSLWSFAQEHPQEQYHKVMDDFIYFIMHPLPYGEKGINAGKRADIQAILHTFKNSMQEMMGKRLVKSRGNINLTGADLQEAELRDSDLNGVWLLDANLCCADFSNAELKGVSLGRAHLSGARLMGADLRGSYFHLAIINAANFFGAKNLTREQIKDCVFIRDHPRYEDLPLLPDGIGNIFKVMSIQEWEGESGVKFEKFKPVWGWESLPKIIFPRW